jgi:hypothetical protein
VGREFWLTPYKAPSISGSLVRFLVITFALFTLVRGIGWASLFGTKSAESLVVLDAAGGIRLWGALLIFGSLYLIAAVLLIRLELAVWAGHVFLFALHVGLTISITQAVWQYHGSGPQAVTVPLSILVWHGVFVWLLRPQAKERE